MQSKLSVIDLFLLLLNTVLVLVFDVSFRYKMFVLDFCPFDSRRHLLLLTMFERPSASASAVSHRIAAVPKIIRPRRYTASIEAYIRGINQSPEYNTSLSDDTEGLGTVTQSKAQRQ